MLSEAGIGLIRVSEAVHLFAIFEPGISAEFARIRPSVRVIAAHQRLRQPALELPERVLNFCAPTVAMRWWRRVALVQYAPTRP